MMIIIIGEMKSPKKNLFKNQKKKNKKNQE